MIETLLAVMLAFGTPAGLDQPNQVNQVTNLTNLTKLTKFYQQLLAAYQLVTTNKRNETYEYIHTQEGIHMPSANYIVGRLY